MAKRRKMSQAEKDRRFVARSRSGKYKKYGVTKKGYHKTRKRPYGPLGAFENVLFKK